MNNLITDSIGVMDFVILNKKIWFVSAYYNFLFKADIDSLVIEDALRLPFGKAFDTFTVLVMHAVDNKIIIFPNRNIGGIVIFDFISESVKVENVCFPDEEWGNGSTEDEKFIYFPIKNKNKLLKFNKQNYRISYVDIPYNINGTAAIKKIKDIIWMVDSYDGKIVSWNLNDNTVFKYDNIKDYKCSIYSQSVCAIVGTEDLYFFPRFANGIIKKHGEKIQLYGNVIEEYIDKVSVFTSVHHIQQGYMGYYNIGNVWRIYNDNMQLVSEITMKFSDRVCSLLNSQSLFEDYQSNVDSEIIIEKDKIFTLNAFIHSL